MTDHLTVYPFTSPLNKDSDLYLLELMCEASKCVVATGFIVYINYNSIEMTLILLNNTKANSHTHANKFELAKESDYNDVMQ